MSAPANEQVDPAVDSPFAGGRSRVRAWLAWMPVLILLPIYLLTAAPTISAAYGGGDGGELAAAVALGAVPHPPGYPTYLALGRAALLLPAGEVAARLVGLSGLCLALAAAALAAAVGLVPLAGANQRALAGVLAGLVFGLDRRVWEQALIVEVYAPSLLFLALLLWLTARWWRWRQPPTAAAAGLALGLGLGLQLPILAWLLGAALAVSRRPPLRAVLLAGAMLALGLSIYGLLFWRGRAVPLGWGDWSSLRGALAHIGGSEYRYLVAAVPWAERLGRIAYAGRDLLTGLGPLGAPLALLGLLGAGGAEIRRWRRLSAGLALATLGWAVSYGGADGTVYLLPLHLLGAFWAGLGAQVAVGWLAARRPGLVRWAWLAPALLLGWLAAWSAPAITLRGETRLRDWALDTLHQAPPHAILVSADDRPTFALWYAQQALGARPDTAVIDSRLWTRDWYRRRLPCAGPGIAGLADCRRPLVFLPPAAPAGP